VSTTWDTQQTLREANASLLTWRAFLRGLAFELETQAGRDTTVAILRATGRHMSAMLALLAVDSLEALQLEMNVVLGEINWGSVRLTLHEADRCVILSHSNLPRIGSAGDPPGTWLAPVLEGLYQGWMGQQAGGNPSFTARIKGYEDDTIIIVYGR
jgi:hypothetical protein